MERVGILKTMIGGKMFQQAFIEWINKSYNLYITVFSVIMVVWASYADKIPPAISWNLSSSLGRAFLLGFLWCVYNYIGFVPAVLTSIAIGITWANRPIVQPGETTHPLPREGFNDNIKKSKTDDKHHKWFVERVLHERPKAIIEDRISTQAAQ
jgi:hypothetical protein